MPTTTNPEHAIRCPWCETPAGQRCTTKRGRDLPIPSHQARIDTWAKQRAADEASETSEPTSD